MPLMPTLPLYDTRETHADAAHHIASPGGYEIWSFAAEDVDRQIYVEGSLSCGYPFHPTYRRRYTKYRRFPTRVPPPLPSDFCCAAFAIYDAQSCRARFVTQVRPEGFRASSDRPQVRVGPSHFDCNENGEFQVHMRGALNGDRTLTAEMTFTPIFSHKTERIALHPREVSGANHFWLPANPLCRAEGEIHIFESGSPAPRVTTFAGFGYHDHFYGTGPLGAGMSSMIRGRVLGEDRAMMFVHAVPSDRNRPEETVFVSADAAGIRQERVAGLRTDERIKFGELLTLHRPRVICANRFSSHVLYDVDQTDQRALCEIVKPTRLSNPFVRHILEKEITHA